MSYKTHYFAQQKFAVDSMSYRMRILEFKMHFWSFHRSLTDFVINNIDGFCCEFDEKSHQ